MTSVLNIADLQCTMKGIQVVCNIWENHTTTLMPLCLSKKQAMKLSRLLMAPYKSNESGLQLRQKNKDKTKTTQFQLGKIKRRVVYVSTT